ncbi:FtsX-like permease family protein, partial [bacterium]|nr:FtsX-like permease family protein [bacterium]
ITKDFPPNTELPFSVMMSLESVRNNKDILLGLDLTSWGNIASNTNTWILLKENAAITEVEAQLPALDKKHFKDPVNDRRFRFQTLSEVHFATDYGSHSGQAADRTLLIALSLVAFFLVITACINFVNLATAQAIRRAKEVGVRKVVGAKRNQLIAQFLSETFLITFVSILLATGLCEFVMPPILSALSLTGFISDLMDIRAFLFLTALTLFVTILSGLYPSLVLSGYKPVAVLKSAATRSAGGRMALRRTLVVIQFVISQVLIIATVIAVGQMDYFRTKDLGFNKEAVLTVPLPSSEQDKLERLRNGLVEYSGIRAVTFAFASGAANFSWNSMLRYQYEGKEERIRANMLVGDEFYISTLGLNLIAGRNYSQSDTLKEIVVNETFVRKLGLMPQDAIGKILIRGNNRPVPIVGVVKDWNTNSLHYGLQPVVLGNYRTLYREAAIKIEMAQSAQALKHIEKIWSGVYPDYVFSSEFLDERIGRFYEQEQLTSNMFKSFAGVAIAIGCLGLFGLVAFMANQKTKEIGVRKVLGASVMDIFKIFTGEFLKLIIFAFLIAGPLAYYAMQHWLEDFEYRITIGPGVFLVALLATVVIAAVTVGYHTYRAATANPVDALKYE